MKLPNKILKDARVAPAKFKLWTPYSSQKHRKITYIPDFRVHPLMAPTNYKTPFSNK